MKGEIDLKNSFECEVQDGKSLAANAKDALERVCSGKYLDSFARYYSPEFVDHVNDMKFQGLEGARRSVELYTKVLSDLDVVVKEPTHRRRMCNFTFRGFRKELRQKDSH